MRSWISVYMKLSDSENAVHCGDKERRNDDHAFWLEDAETRETLARMEAMLPLCPSPCRAMKNPSALQQITVWLLWSCAVFGVRDEQLKPADFYYYIYGNFHVWFHVLVFVIIILSTILTTQTIQKHINWYYLLWSFLLVFFCF